jgi:NTE family protein
MTHTSVAAAAGPPPLSISCEDEDPGLTVCLSGGGFRATLFHLGALRRLNELGVLAKVAVISSVSGGSILNGILATRWQHLKLDVDGTFTNFEELVASTTRRFCRRDLRTRLLLGERLNPVNWGVLFRDFGSVSANFLAQAYERLFEKQRLADLPVPALLVPRFIFCATSVQTGACWHFHGGPKGRMGDFYTGYFDVGGVQVSEAVAASSAFPPGFGALRLRVPADAELSRVDPWGKLRGLPAKRRDLPGSSKRLILLTDGGVYDNLGVEPIWSRSRTLLVSDAGRPFESVPNCHQALFLRLRRAFEISAEQVGAVRKRWLIDELLRGQRTGAFWAINTRLEDFPLHNAQGYTERLRDLFPAIRTDFNAFQDGEIACLENHGYSLADAALRSRARQLCTRPDVEFCWPHCDSCQEEVVRRALYRSKSRRLFHDFWAILCGRA